METRNMRELGRIINSSVYEHNELLNYLDTLKREQLIELFKITIKNTLKDFNISKFTNDILIQVIIYNNTLNNKSDAELIKRCKEALDGLAKEPNSYNNFNIDSENEDECENDLLNSNYYFSQNDILGMFLLNNYNIIPLNEVFLDSIEEEKNKPTIIKVIRKNIKFSHLMKQIEEYVNRLFGMYNDKYILGDIAKRFNLNFRIHTYNSKTKQEELLRKDNEGWIIKKKPSQIKYEVGNIGGHFFTYEYLNIPKDYLNDINKLLAYFMVVGIDGMNNIKDVNNKNKTYEKTTSLDLVITLKKLGFIGWYVHPISNNITHDLGTNTKFNKLLMYMNNDISDHGILKRERILKALEKLSENKEELIKYYR